jgi:hypothetical protein
VGPAPFHGAGGTASCAQAGHEKVTTASNATRFAKDRIADLETRVQITLAYPIDPLAIGAATALSHRPLSCAHHGEFSDVGDRLVRLSAVPDIA